MKNRKNKNSNIESNYNRNEEFDINSIPKHFDSVTNESLKKLKRAAIERVERDTNLKPGALQMDLKSVDGQFEEAYSTLEGDYSARLAKLQNVYTEAISNVRKAFKNYELQVEEHNVAFQNYSKANKALYGEPLSGKLQVSSTEIEELRKAINEL